MLVLKHLGRIFKATDIQEENFLFFLGVQRLFFGWCSRPTYGFMLNRSRTATLALHSRFRFRSVKSLSLVQVMWTRSGPLSALSFIVAWDAVFLSWMSWAWERGGDKNEKIEITLTKGIFQGWDRMNIHWTKWKEGHNAKEGRND